MVSAINKENLDNMNLNELYQASKDASTITSYTNPDLLEAFKDLIKKNQHNLSAQFMPYCLYQDNEQTYVLIHVDYLESKGNKHSDMSQLSNKEGAYLHNELKKSDLAIDYLFIMPYYNYIDRTIGSFLSEPVVTNEKREMD